MRDKNVILTTSIIYLYCSCLFAQIEIASIGAVSLSEKGFINNTVWSIDNKKIAFQFNGQKQHTNVMIYKIGEKDGAKPIFEMKNDDLFNPVVNEISTWLPSWSSLDNNTLYFLYRSEAVDPTMNLRKYTIKDYTKLPLSVIGKIGKKHFDNITNISSIIPESGIAEYHTVSIENEVEYLFVRQDGSPDVIQYTDQFAPLERKGELNKMIESDESIDSFVLYKDASNIIICKGNDKEKIFILGVIDINTEKLQAIDYNEVIIRKSNKGAVLQEPSFNPVNSNMIAYLEMNDSGYKEYAYFLYIKEIGSKQNKCLAKNLYRNENNKYTRPNSTSYVWHPSGDYIFYITTDEKRNVAFIDLRNLSKPIIKILKTDIEFAERLTISPDGKYLTIMTQITDEKNSNAWGGLFLVELQY